MIHEAGEFAEQDTDERDKVLAGNTLEACLYNLKNSINDTLEGKLGEDDKTILSKTVEDALFGLKITQPLRKMNTIRNKRRSSMSRIPY